MDGKIIKPTKSDATSTELKEDWNDLSFPALQAAARRFNLDRAKHGRFNWQKGDEEFAEERYSHMLRHAYLFQQFRRQEDLDALLCNAMMVAWYKDKGFFKEFTGVSASFQQGEFEKSHGSATDTLGKAETMRREGLRTQPKPGEPGYVDK